jgi:hypothetical protein
MGTHRSDSQSDAFFNAARKTQETQRELQIAAAMANQLSWRSALRLQKIVYTKIRRQRESPRKLGRRFFY